MSLALQRESSFAHQIRDRALSLTYELGRFPATEATGRAWLFLALAWTQKYGQHELAKEIESMCFGMHCPHESHTGECTFAGRSFPCGTESSEVFIFEPDDDPTEDAA